MSFTNTLSNSFQSIPNVVGINVKNNNRNRHSIERRNGHNDNENHNYIYGTGSLGRLRYKNQDNNDDELNYSQLSKSTEILERVKSERVLSNKENEKRRPRTIIIEKRNDSFGFTLQSYGIHYKKENEVEMITYVDYVEHDGPAYKTGMREGDVILSINGKDMEKADHKTLVDCIKSCQTRMRLVVLFEDCVRKNLLQSKLSELERICLRERELLGGKWTTHSLPARKKMTITKTNTIDTVVTNCPTVINPKLTSHRSILSTEDVTLFGCHSLNAIIPPPAQFTMSCQYLEPSYQCVINHENAADSNDVCYVSIVEPLKNKDGRFNFASNISIKQISTLKRNLEGTSSKSKTCDKYHNLSHRPQESHHYLNYSHKQQKQKHSESDNITQEKATKSEQFHGHSCNPCIDFRWKSRPKSTRPTIVYSGEEKSGFIGNGDNISLDAYDLPSPCCNIRCVPGRRRIRHIYKEHAHKHKHLDTEQERDCKNTSVRAKSLSHISQNILAQNNNYHELQHYRQRHNISHEMPAYPYQYQKIPIKHYYPYVYDLDTQSMKSTRSSPYFDINSISGFDSRCSLHFCLSSDIKFSKQDSESIISISADTFSSDAKTEAGSDPSHHSIKSRQSCQQKLEKHFQIHQSNYKPQIQQRQHMHNIYQHQYPITATKMKLVDVSPSTACVHKPKSWDNLTAANVSRFSSGDYTNGSIHLQDIVKPTGNLSHQTVLQRHSIPRHNSYGRHSIYIDVENYAPPPSQFIEHITKTTTTIAAKSTEELLIINSNNVELRKKQTEHTNKDNKLNLASAELWNANINSNFIVNPNHIGYYSHLPPSKTDAITLTHSVTSNRNIDQCVDLNRDFNASMDTESIATVTEITRL